MLILLSGLPGSGKTTLAQAIVTRLGPDRVNHIESDAVRKGLFRVPAYTGRENARVFDEVERRARKALRQGQHPLVDATNLLARDRVRFERLAARTGCGLLPVRVTAPAAVVRQRLSGGPRAGHSDASVAVYERMLGREEPLAGRHIVADTRYDTKSTVDLLADLIEVNHAWTPPGPS